MKIKLPAKFLKQLKSLEDSYLKETDPIRQSGFGGGEERWRQEREPILDAIDSDGDFLDIGCANGYLLECLIAWANDRGMKITPYGLDIWEKLIKIARERLKKYKDNFYVGNAWEWIPPWKFQYVYTLYDCVPEQYLEEYIKRLLSNVVEPNGRLIIGAYGSLTRSEPPYDLVGFLKSRNFEIVGHSNGGNPPVSLFVWLDNKI